MSAATVSVLAGAYKGHRASLKVTLTHTVLNLGSDRAICGAPNMSDYGDDMDAPPTCLKCLKKDTRTF